MGFTYVHPINAYRFLYKSNNNLLASYDNRLISRVRGDLHLTKEGDTTAGVTYSFALSDLACGIDQCLEIPLINRKKQSIENLTIKYFCSTCVTALDSSQFANATLVYKNTISDKCVSIDVSDLIANIDLEQFSVITFIVYADAPASYQIGVYATEQNLENISIKMNSSSMSTYSLRRVVAGESEQEQVLTESESFVDKYYFDWESDIADAIIQAREYSTYTVVPNETLDLLYNTDNSSCSSLAIELTTDLSDSVVNYNQYGSVVNEDNRQEATGYFYTKVLGDRYWVIDPDGYPNVVKNVLFPLPQLNTPDAIRLNDTLLTEFSDISSWCMQTELNLKSLGFNTYEQYYSIINNNSFTYSNLNTIVKLPLLDSWSRVFGFTDRIDKLSICNIFHPEFENKIKWKLETIILKNNLQNDNRILAYTLDNEPAFVRDDLILCLATTDNKLIYRKEAARRWLKLRYGLEAATIADVTDVMCDEFISFEFYVYSRVITSLLRALDANHMIFSPALQWFKFSTTRGFLQNNDSFLKVLNKFYDALLLTHYSTYDILNEGFDTLKLSIPVLLNEFSMKSAGEPGFIDKLAGPSVASQADRGKYFEHIALQCIKNRNCIGYTWYQYSDIKLPDGIVNRGIVNHTNTIYEDLGKSMKKINTNAEKIRKEELNAIS